MADTKFSQIADGSAFVVATDKVITLRSGTTDLVTTLGTLAAQSGTFSGTSSGTNTGDQTITLTGNVTGTGTGSFATTIAAGAVTGAMLSGTGAARVVGVTLDGGGSALTTGQKGYVTCPFAGTITAWNITADTGTCTFDVWKIATGTAVPTVANTITASAKPALATGTAIHSTGLSGWTTSVAANDIFGFNLDAVSGATKLNLEIQLNIT